MPNLGLKVADVIRKFYSVEENQDVRGLYEVRNPGEPQGELLWYFFSSNNATYHSSGNDCVIRDINQSNSRYIDRLIAAFEKAKNESKKIFWLVLVYGDGIGLVPQDMEWMASIEVKKDFDSITASLRMTEYPIGRGRTGEWLPCRKRVDQDKYFSCTFMSCKDESGEFTDQYMRDYFEIYDNRPYRKTILEKEDYNDIFDHNLYGIHITSENEALSDDYPHVCIGWSVLGDLSSLDYSQLAEKYNAQFAEDPANSRGQNIGQLWRFVGETQIGDYVIYAEPKVFHIGRIESDYFFDERDYPVQNEDYKNARVVKWLKKYVDRKSISQSFHRSLATGMSYFTINDYRSAVYDLLRNNYTKDDNIVEEVNMSLDYNTELMTEFKERNRIVFGAPGTGKSFLLKEDCQRLLKGTEGSFERVTFHPDYTYSQFVGSYKPVMDEDGHSIKYNYVPGPFMRIYVKALESIKNNDPQPHLLLIEEINRAKVASVFGDVFQLLDRDSDGVSEYEIQTSEDIRKFLGSELQMDSNVFDTIKIPNNMFIWATMNSADQGVYPMDTAFKRRWNFEYIGIDSNEKEISDIAKVVLPNHSEPVSWNQLRKAINAKLVSNDFRINEDKLLGPYFLSKKLLESDDEGNIIDSSEFIRAFKSKVIMYLYEDAVKQGRNRFFDGCDSSKYSAVCDAFDKKGMGIFGDNFVDMFFEE